MTQIKVGDIMTRDYISVSADANISDCAKMMIKKKVGSLIVKKEGKLKGLLTERDIIWAMTKKSCSELDKIKAEEIAKKKLVTIKPSEDMHTALQKMKKTKYRWLPVVHKNEVVGFLTLKDILKIEPELFEVAQTNDTFQIREEQEKLRRTGLRASNMAKEGSCEECGSYDFLNRIDGRLLCDNCKEDM